MKSKLAFETLERRRQPLAQRIVFLRRLARHFAASAAIVFLSLLMGTLGYHHFEDQRWIDAILNASMILGGMGPVDPLHTDSGKLFASAYALYSGLVLVTTAAMLLAVPMHRMLHRFHLEEEQQRDE